VSVQRQTAIASLIPAASPTSDFDFVLELTRAFGDDVPLGRALHFWILPDVACEVELGYSADGGATYLMDGHRFRVCPFDGWGFVAEFPGTNVRVRVHRLAAFGDVTVTLVASVR
jgi:hypothetical protein